MPPKRPIMRDEIAKLIESLAKPAGSSSDFDLNPDVDRPKADALRPAAVLLPIWVRPQGLQLILTKRASHLEHHPGQIAFPGGKVDATDVDACAAALREADEEIGLPPNAVAVLGALPRHETVTGFSITPILGLIRADFDPVAQPDEVEEVFAIPLAHVLQSVNYRIEGRIWMGHARRYIVLPFGPYYIWGATARILRGLAERVSS